MTMATQTDPLAKLANAHRTYCVSHAGETHHNVSFAAVDALVARLARVAPGAPSVEETATRASPSTAVQPAYTQRTAAQDSGADASIDARGLARSEADRAAAQAVADATGNQGFAPAQTVFERGRRVVDMGVSNARKFREEYDRKPKIGDACDDLIAAVHGERREDRSVVRSAVLMDSKGLLVLPKIGDKSPERLEVEEAAFRSLVSRLGLPQGASQYLAATWPELRARNINQWQGRAQMGEDLERQKIATKGGTPYEAAQLLLRTRLNEKGDRVAYGVVSDGYTEFDADKLARAVKLALPPEARADITYDGRRAKISALFHSTVNPKDYVAGEFFRAGIVVKTDDTGGGSVTGYGVLEQNLCLNLYILSEKALPLFRVRHIGDPVKLAQKIREGLKKGEEALAHFLEAWGYARKDDIAAKAKERGELYEGMSMTAVFAALANGTIERELVPIRGRRTETVSELVQAWEMDKSADGPKSGTVTRAGLTNAFTRWAHESQASDEFFSTEVEQAASALLWPADRRLATPPVIPALPLDLV